MDKRYTGTEPVTSRAQVIRYLAMNFLHADGTEVTAQQAREAIEKPENAADIEQAIRFRSNAYYPGDQIGGREGWTEIPLDEEDEDDDDDDL
jgi:hypothetical protein